MIDQNKLHNLAQNEEFVKKVIRMDQFAAAEAFRNEGVDVSSEELEEAAKLLNAMVQNGEELDEEKLTEISGGGKVADFCLGFLGGLGIGVAAVWIGIVAVSW